MIKTLAIETSGKKGTLALFENDQLVIDRNLSATQRTAQSLAPAMLDALNRSGWKALEIDCVATTTGPGSFTGLRIGVTTAKTLAYAVQAEVVGLNTLQVIAAQVPDNGADVHVILDAQRQQLFHARYNTGATPLPKTLDPVEVIDLAEITNRLGNSSIVTGPAVSRLTDLSHGATYAPENLRNPHAVTVGKLAFLEAQQGNTMDCWSLIPNYYRRSAAEEKLDR